MLRMPLEPGAGEPAGGGETQAALAGVLDGGADERGADPLPAVLRGDHRGAQVADAIAERVRPVGEHPHDAVAGERLEAIAILIVDQPHVRGSAGLLVHARNATLPLMPPPLIWHITELAAWEAAVREGTYTCSTRGRDLAEVGFLHACWPEQVSMVAMRVYPDRPADLVILEIDVARVEATGVAVDIEADRDGRGRGYPHINGPLPIGAVQRLRRTKWIGREFVVVA